MDSPAPTVVACLGDSIASGWFVQSLKRLIANLDSDEFELRERASRELVRMDSTAREALEKALADRPSLEVKTRIESIVQEINGANLPPERLQVMRLVEVLELTGTPEARRVLHSIVAERKQSCLKAYAAEALRRSPP